jgi:hypothetical protein
MTPRDLLTRLEAEGCTAELKLKLEGAKPSPETLELVKTHKDALLEHLATDSCGRSNDARVHHLHLPPTLVRNLMVWINRDHKLCILRPNGLTCNARPEHVTEALGTYPWGVVYRADLYLLLTWGAPPESALEGLHDLVTGELLIPDRVAA